MAAHDCQTRAARRAPQAARRSRSAAPLSRCSLRLASWTVKQCDIFRPARARLGHRIATGQEGRRLTMARVMLRRMVGASRARTGERGRAPTPGNTKRFGAGGTNVGEGRREGGAGSEAQRQAGVPRALAEEPGGVGRRASARVWTEG
ncbi:hypothetical protein ERJ75_000573900 [Trypanosoma vivax]|nr:hypothetical protein ERJ75_000573900 [Trypanosoma vivax]